MQKGNSSITATSVDEYLRVLPDTARGTLQKIRKIIKTTVPKADEVISYQIPIFKYNGALVSFAAFKNHCSFFPMSYAVMSQFSDELKPYNTSGGTIRFPHDKPLPATLVKKLVKARIVENEIRFLAKKNKYTSVQKKDTNNENVVRNKEKRMDKINE